MREALFIKKNKDRWLKSQKQSTANPDEMARDFTRLLDDLAYAKTFYPSGKVTQFVNAEAGKIYLSIYKSRKEESNRIIRFWRYGLPLLFFRHRRVMLFVFIVFLLFFFFGFFASNQNEDFTRAMLPGNYVDMTKENIENGNPFGVYETGNPFLSWLQLMIHNIRISVLAFVSGLFCAIPTVYILINNSMMLGAFNELFMSNGLGLSFWLVVFVHGALEITAIIVSCAAGVVLGKSFLFPGTAKRMEAFKIGAKEGVKMLLGLMPVFALAAFFEGFVTRLYNDIPALTTVIVSLSFLFVLYYFVIYPLRLGKRLAHQLYKNTLAFQ